MANRFAKVATVFAAAGLLVTGLGMGGVAGASSAHHSKNHHAAHARKKKGNLKGVKGKLTIGVFNPFSGTTASFGPLMMAGCIPAERAINKDGGIYGHKVNCTPVDSRGDPVDAVPAADKLVATSKNLIMAIGPSSDTALATVPIFQAAKVPMFPDAGNAAFDKSKYNYLWRLIPPDAATGVAMAVWAKKEGYTRAANIYTSAVGAGTGPAGIQAGFPAVGGKIVYKAVLTPGQPTYESTINAMLATHPQVIFYEAGPPTSATFFSELKSLGKVLPTIGPEAIYEPQWDQAVSGVLGSKTLAKTVSIVEGFVTTKHKGFPVWKKELLASASQVPKAKTYLTDPFALANYNAVNMVSLAIMEKQTTKRPVINKTLNSIIKPGKHKKTCDSFAQCKTDILKGKKIRYIGATGPINLNKWHNAGGTYHVITDALHPKSLGKIGSAKVAPVIAKAKFSTKH